MRIRLWAVAVIFAFVGLFLTARGDIPPLARLKAAAEAGDPEAKYEFALRFPAGSAEWQQWLERSASQGNGRAEDELACTLNWSKFSTYFADEKMRAAHLRSSGPSMRNALITASSAADKGFPRSRMLLGMAFAHGYLVSLDQAEAYKWLKLSNSAGFMADIAAGEGAIAQGDAPSRG